jgi:hypothetical protein
MDIVVPSEALSYEAITVTNAVIGFTAGLLNPGGAAPPRGAILTLETASIRWRIDGGNPSGTVGHLMATTDSIVLHGANTLANFRAYRATGADASLRVTYLLA